MRKPTSGVPKSLATTLTLETAGCDHDHDHNHDHDGDDDDHLFIDIVLQPVLCVCVWGTTSGILHRRACIQVQT